MDMLYKKEIKSIVFRSTNLVRNIGAIVVHHRITQSYHILNLGMGPGASGPTAQKLSKKPFNFKLRTLMGNSLKNSFSVFLKKLLSFFTTSLPC